MYINNTLYKHRANSIDSYLNIQSTETPKKLFNDKRVNSWPPNNVKDYNEIENNIKYYITYAKSKKQINIKKKIKLSTAKKINLHETYITFYKLKAPINAISKVAVKKYDCIKPKFLFDLDNNSSALKEIYALVKLKNENNIVKMLGVFATKKHCNIVMESADMDLFHYQKFISTKDIPRLSTNNIAYIFRELLLTVVACSKYNIDHMDITSKNLLVFFTAKKIKLCDFEYMQESYNCSNMIKEMISCMRIFSAASYGHESNQTDIMHEFLEPKQEIVNPSFIPYSQAEIENIYLDFDGDHRLVDIIIEIETLMLLTLKYKPEKDFNKFIDFSKIINLFEQKCKPLPFP